MNDNTGSILGLFFGALALAGAILIIVTLIVS